MMMAGCMQMIQNQIIAVNSVDYEPNGEFNQIPALNRVLSLGGNKQKERIFFDNIHRTQGMVHPRQAPIEFVTMVVDGDYDLKKLRDSIVDTNSYYVDTKKT